MHDAGASGSAAHGEATLLGRDEHGIATSLGRNHSKSVGSASSQESQLEHDIFLCDKICFPAIYVLLA